MKGRLFALTLLTALGLMGPPVAAQVVLGNNDTCGRAGAAAGCAASGNNPVADVARRATDLGAFIGGIVAVIFIIVGGVKYVLSSGESDRLESARNTIVYSIVGLFVIVLARTIIGFVIGRL